MADCNKAGLAKIGNNRNESASMGRTRILALLDDDVWLPKVLLTQEKQ